MDKKQICIKFSREICDILDIPVPFIKFVSADRMHTGTQIAALTPNAVLIRDDIAVSPELFFALAHELRHAYQIAGGESLEEYRTSDRISIEQYNLQPLEVDANAFGALIMSDFFGIVPQFRNMPDTVRKAIKDRMKQLQKEYT
ncbi:hypothetical protein [Coprococcus comes]|uniref:hypothetical protein n=1 Tax=Coprococcus comes TaxID=410072 RepID=UPI001897A394|nr:hypothetical protein [Coprococcus comes]